MDFDWYLLLLISYYILLYYIQSQFHFYVPRNMITLLTF